MLFLKDTVLCCTRREHVERKLEQRRRAMEEQGLKISGKNTEYLGCNEHQDTDIHLEGETVKIMDIDRRTLTEDGELYAEVTIECRADGRTGRVSGVLSLV